MRNYQQVRFPLIKIIIIALFFFALGFFSSTFAVIFITPHKKLVTVPHLIKKDYSQAQKILKREKLKSKVSFKYSNTIPKNQIISQLPSPGKQVRIGRCIEIIVSKGPALIEVPDITGKTLLEAKNILNMAGRGNIRGLKVGEVTYVHSNEVKRDSIIAQNPIAGRIIPKDSPVNILVSLGPQRSSFFMPNLKGLKLKEALSILKRMGLILKKVEHKIVEEEEKGIVLEHIPCENTKVRKNDLVSLVVSTKKSKEKLKYRHAFIYYKVPEGFYKSQVKILVQDSKGTREVFNQKKNPGSKIELLVQIIGKAKAFIYLNEVLKEEKEL
jgi:serine/threonine-protein kinase